MKITESRTKDLLHWLDGMTADRTLLFGEMTLYRDAAALIRQLQAAEQAAWHAGLDAGRAQGRGKDHAHPSPSVEVGVEDEPGAVRALVTAANAVLALYPHEDQLWSLESAVRPFNATRPAECSGGCPPQQVCDYCQIASLAQQPVGVDELAQVIREVDGNHSLGAGALAEAILENLPTLAQQPVAVTDATVARLTKDQRTRLVEKLVADQVEGADRMSSYLWSVLKDGFKGYNNYTDQELLDAHWGAFDEDFFGLESGDDQ